VNLSEFDAYIRSFLAIEEMERIDASRNGVQVERKDPKLKKVAFAVDAAQEVFEAAVKWGADLLFVHHGLYWGHEAILTGHYYRRIRYLLEHDLGLYAVHLPLDAHLRYGNNAGMAQKLGLVDVEPFGLYRGIPIGVSGTLKEPMTVDGVVDALFGDRFTPLGVVRSGPDSVRRIGLISGSAAREVEQAIELDLDLYITGDASHTIYHRCREDGIHVIFGGHYATEVWGVQLMSEKVAADTALQTRFIDIPTEL